MLIALFGVTGVGKSFYKDQICEKLKFEKLTTIRTRKPRAGEMVDKSCMFVSTEELDEMEQTGKIGYRFGVFSSEYAYLKNEIEAKNNRVFEMHYTQLEDWKEIAKDLITIYILPSDINKTKEKLHERNLAKEKEEIRLTEIEEQYNLVTCNPEMLKKFDYVFTNNYDENSAEDMIELVRGILNNADYGVGIS